MPASFSFIVSLSSLFFFFFCFVAPLSFLPFALCFLLLLLLLLAGFVVFPWREGAHTQRFSIRGGLLDVTRAGQGPGLGIIIILDLLEPETTRRALPTHSSVF